MTEWIDEWFNFQGKESFHIIPQLHTYLWGTGNLSCPLQSTHAHGICRSTHAHMHTAYAGVSHTLPSGCTGHSGSPATPHLLSALCSHSKNICFFHISSAGEIAQGLREAAQCNPDLVLSCWEVWPYMPHISVSIPFSSLSLYCYHKTHVSA